MTRNPGVPPSGRDRAAASLHGIGVLITRPREQADALVAPLRDLGANPILFPALAILPPADPDALRQIVARLDEFQLAIFISPSAASRGLAEVLALREWPPGLAVAAVGKGTAKTLRALGMQNVLAPDTGSDSEHLLALARLRNVAGQSVIIFRGEGGRETLAQALHERGAGVGYAECYRRGLPQQADAAPILARFAAGEIQAVTAYSSETLDNLFRLLGDAGGDCLRQTPLFVPHPRIAAHARQLGIATVIAPAVPEHGLISSLVEYFTEHFNRNHD